MDWINPTPRRVVVAYYCLGAVLWLSMLLTTLGAASNVVPPHAGAATRLMLAFAALALHALAVAAWAWKFPRWFFGHGAFAVSFCTLPIIFLAPALWIVAALLYAIGVGYVWEASRRERPGQLQAPPRERDRAGGASGRTSGHTNHMFG